MRRWIKASEPYASRVRFVLSILKEGLDTGAEHEMWQSTKLDNLRISTNSSDDMRRIEGDLSELERRGFVEFRGRTAVYRGREHVHNGPEMKITSAGVAELERLGGPVQIHEIEEAASRGREIRFGPDFRAAVWGRKQFSFTTDQAVAVKLLAEARENGTLDLAGETILDAVRGDATPERPRLDSLFRGNDAWQTMIASGKRRGTYRIADPPA